MTAAETRFESFLYFAKHAWQIDRAAMAEEETNGDAGKREVSISKKTARREFRRNVAQS
jgi:hypothetical protein